MNDHIDELLHRNLQNVFGEGDAARRRGRCLFFATQYSNDLRIITSELSAAELSSATTSSTVRFASTGFIPRFTSAEIASSSEPAGIRLPGVAARVGPLIGAVDDATSFKSPPGTESIRSTSPFAIAATSSSGARTERIVNASFGPTCCTLISRSKARFSVPVENP